MPDKVLILSPGLWRLRDEVAALTGLEPVRGIMFPGSTAAVAGWGHKPTAERARRIGRTHSIPYIAIEDGFLRSVRPGNDMRPSAMVIDRSGIYYDARQISDLEALINGGGLGTSDTARAETAMALLRERRLSKYNAAPGDTQLPFKSYCLIIDQTVGDASISGGLADANSFKCMVERALEDAGERPVVVKLHPETLTGRKSGYLAQVAGDRRLTVLATPCNPWDLIAGAHCIYTVSSQLGFEALMAGKQVRCFGAPFYAGWGLTRDELALPRRARRATVAEVFTAAYIRYSHYFDAWTRKPIDLETAIDQLTFLRDRFLCNRKGIVFYRLPLWKRKPLKRLLDGPGPAPVYARSLADAIAAARRSGARIAAWGREANTVRAQVQYEGVELISIEDGFLRSAGLGAALTPSLSFAIDRKGIYYDASAESELEHLLQRYAVGPSLAGRAESLRKQIVAHNLSKYNLVADALLPPLPGQRRKVLVIGQVADDEAVTKSLSQPAANINSVMLARVREEAPDAFVIYKPHPDVERLGRAGRIAEADAGQLCDTVFRDVPIGAALAASDEVAVFTSLAGFEALIRGKPVRVFGRPFYAGWGLTSDIQTFPRRTRRLALDELVAIALIVYPHYYDPVSHLPCPVEVAVERLIEMRDRPRRLADSTREAIGKGILLYRKLRTGRR